MVIVGVTPGCYLEEAGLRSGMLILSIADPIRSGVMWPLDKRSSIRMVRHTLHFQHGRNVEIDLLPDGKASPASIPASPPRQQASCVPASSAITRAQALLQQGTGRARGQHRTGARRPCAGGSSAAQIVRLTPFHASRLMQCTGLTVVTAAAAAFGGRSRRAGLLTMSMQSRVGALSCHASQAELVFHMEQTSGKGNSRLLLIVASFVLIPPICILIAAIQSGYLDQLSSVYKGKY
ncbi:hypothetical protein MMC07_005698 [Pseudocyphellaria aurata]|nr:hypothetical protein [Pseudocyphellaria aurata]